jgi:hypothetical protein
MAAPELPRQYTSALHDLGARLLDARKPKSPLDALARDLLVGFHDLCMRSGLDRVLDELAIADVAELDDHATLVPALVARLDAIALDGGGPRGAKPRQVADALVAALGLAVVDETDRSIALGDDVRREVAAAAARVIEVELVVPKIRDTMIAETRARLELRYRADFDKIAPRLDDHGRRITSPPKVPIDALHAAQRALVETRNAVLARVLGAAIDGAKAAIAAHDPDAAARIDQPITLRLTPREVVIARACEPRAPTSPATITQELVESLGELARIAWRVAEKPVRPYKASEVFAIGDVVEHPTFGRGTVVSGLGKRIEIEFADGKRTLVHAGK